MAETTLDSTPTGNKKLSAESAQKLSPLFETFLTYYDKSTEGNPDWLSSTLQSENPEKSSEEISALSDNIRQSVNIWNENLASLNDYCDEGNSKEEWLAERLQEAGEGEDAAEYNQGLAQAGGTLHAYNEQTINRLAGRELVDDEDSDIIEAEPVESPNWEEEDTSALASHLAKEVNVANLAGTVLREGWKMAEALPESEGFTGLKKVADALRSGEDSDVKAAATAALQTGIDRGLVPIIPKDAPISVVSGVACYGVEQAKIMLQYADGDISGAKALEMSGRTAAAMIAHPLSEKFTAMGCALGRKAGAAIGAAVGSIVPILAPVAATIGGFIGGVVGKVAGSAIGQAIKRGAQKIVDVAKPVLKNAWEGIKSVGSSIISGVKSFLSSIFD